MALPSEAYQRIYAIVARVPRGRVASYGQIAALADMPRQARLVGYALNALAAGNRLPWHRVVNAQGRISERGDGGAAALAQRKRLEKEGVRFSPQGLIDLAVFGWKPE